LYKYLPQFDELYPAIAQRVPRSRFIFLAHPRVPEVTATFQQRLERAFARAGLRWTDHCRFVPHLCHADYFALNRLSDVFLDTPGWSGGNTTLEALACALPVVTLPGATMRSRHAFAMLKVLGLEACIATSEADYVSIAARLAGDGVWREAVRAQILERVDRSLFGQDACVRQLETWLEDRLRGRTSRT
jgi:predicted O-linked N-acetylglucosamine transferase (SPINDLY family)